MSSLLAKRICSSLFPSYYYHLPRLLSPLLRLSLSTQPQHQQKENPFLAQYLISSFGFLPARALKVSASSNLISIKTPELPNSVVSFLKDVGLSDPEIKKTVLGFPKLLCYNAERTLRPRYHELIAAGFSREILISLIQYDPKALCHMDILSRLQFWRDFVGNSEDSLSKVIRRSRWLMDFDIGRRVVPRLNLLKEYGLSNPDIVKLLTLRGSCMFRSVESLRQILEQTETFGFLRGSAMFVRGLNMIACHTNKTLERKIEFFKKTFGWSGDEVYTALRMFPAILSCSEKKLKLTMEFLIRTAKLDPRSIASHPALFGYSLERTLIPRYHVVSILESKGLKKNWGLLGAITTSEERFIKRFVVRYEKDMPGIREAYVSAQSGKVPDLEMVISANL